VRFGGALLHSQANNSKLKPKIASEINSNGNGNAFVSDQKYQSKGNSEADNLNIDLEALELKSKCKSKKSNTVAQTTKKTKTKNKFAGTAGGSVVGPVNLTERCFFSASENGIVGVWK